MVNLSMLQPQPVPVLNDDVLQHIFGHLDIYTLYMVAQCSSRFQALAQSTFVRSLKGRFVWRRQFPCADRALRLFGPNVKHLEINRKLNTTNPWPLIDHTQLKSLRICFYRSYRSYRSSAFLLEFVQTLKEKCGPFVAVKTLEFSYEFQTKTNHVADIILEMQLGYWCPNLETFHYFDGHFNVIAEHIQPATLQCLSTMPFNYNLRLHSLLKQHPDNPIVSVHLYAYDSDTLMYVYHMGVQNFIEKLVYQGGIRDEKESFLLASSLHLFEQLKDITINYDYCQHIDLFLGMALFQMNALISLDISVSRQCMLKHTMFLDLLEWQLPNALQVFRCGLSHSDISDTEWTKFVTKMPITCKCIRYDGVLEG